MNDKTLNKPINLQNLSLALAKVKAEYIARIMQSREYAQIETHDAIIKVINNLPGMWVQLSSNLTDSLADCICVRLQDSDTPAVHILVRQFVESDPNYEFSSLYGDETLSWSDSEQAWIYMYPNNDGGSYEDILVNEALEEFVANAKVFVPEYSRYKKFLGDSVTEDTYLNTADEFFNCVGIELEGEDILLLRMPHSNPPMFSSINGHILSYDSRSGWYYDGAAVSSDLSSFSSPVVGYISKYVERDRLANLIAGVQSGRWMDMMYNISGLDALLDIKPSMLFINGEYYFRSPYAENQYDTSYNHYQSLYYVDSGDADGYWMLGTEQVNASLESELIKDGTMYIPNKPGITTIICGAGEYNPVTLEPTLAGEEGMTYLVPKPPETAATTIGSAVIGQSTIGTSTYTDPTNGYQEWIYTHGAYERVGEKIATDKEFEDMLKSIGLVDSTAVADEAVVGEALVG